MKVAALIPAAGKSRRMGRPKLALMLHGQTVLEHVIAAARTAGASPVLVVIAPRAADLAAIARASSADVFQLAEDTPDMRTTVQAGLDWLEQTHRFSPDDAWLLLPADHPTLDAAAIVPLIEQARGDVAGDVFLPVFEGKRGHPTLIRFRIAPDIRALPPETGLNVLFRKLGSRVREVPSPSADVLRDMDTPEDYEALRQRPAHPAS